MGLASDIAAEARARIAGAMLSNAAAETVRFPMPAHKRLLVWAKRVPWGYVTGRKYDHRGKRMPDHWEPGTLSIRRPTDEYKLWPRLSEKFKSTAS